MRGAGSPPWHVRLAASWPTPPRCGRRPSGGSGSAAIVTVVGAQLSVVAVPTQLYELTGSSAWVGLTGLFGLVPLIVFGLWGGAIADAVDRRGLLVFTGTGLAVTSLLLGLATVTGIGGPWEVLTLYAVQTAFLAINQPTRAAVLPRLLPTTSCPRPTRCCSP